MDSSDSVYCMYNNFVGEVRNCILCVLEKAGLRLTWKRKTKKLNKMCEGTIIIPPRRHGIENCTFTWVAYSWSHNQGIGRHER